VSERDAVREALSRMSVRYAAMEYFGSFPAEPLTKRLEKVRSSYVLILVLGSRYGFVPDGHDKSMTELKYSEAISAEIPVFAYLREVPTYNRQSMDAKVAAFRDLVSKAHGRSEFASPHDLAW
jgi:Domain of unknown function (DUF4062)